MKEKKRGVINAGYHSFWKKSIHQTHYTLLVCQACGEKVGFAGINIYFSRGTLKKFYEAKGLLCFRVLSLLSPELVEGWEATIPPIIRIGWERSSWR